MPPVVFRSWVFEWAVPRSLILLEFYTTVNVASSPDLAEGPPFYGQAGFGENLR